MFLDGDTSQIEMVPDSYFQRVISSDLEENDNSILLKNNDSINSINCVLPEIEHQQSKPRSKDKDVICLNTINPEDKAKHVVNLLQYTDREQHRDYPIEDEVQIISPSSNESLHYRQSNSAYSTIVGETELFPLPSIGLTDSTSHVGEGDDEAFKNSMEMGTLQNIDDSSPFLVNRDEILTRNQNLISEGYEETMLSNSNDGTIITSLTGQLSNSVDLENSNAMGRKDDITSLSILDQIISESSNLNFDNSNSSQVYQPLMNDSSGQCMSAKDAEGTAIGFSRKNNPYSSSSSNNSPSSSRIIVRKGMAKKSFQGSSGMNESRDENNSNGKNGAKHDGESSSFEKSQTGTFFILPPINKFLHIITYVYIFN